jgi:hypothetical protein
VHGEAIVLATKTRPSQGSIADAPYLSASFVNRISNRSAGSPARQSPIAGVSSGTSNVADVVVRSASTATSVDHRAELEASR